MEDKWSERDRRKGNDFSSSETELTSQGKKRAATPPTCKTRQKE